MSKDERSVAMDANGFVWMASWKLEDGEYDVREKREHNSRGPVVFIVESKRGDSERKWV